MCAGGADSKLGAEPNPGSLALPPGLTPSTPPGTWEPRYVPLQPALAQQNAEQAAALSAGIGRGTRVAPPPGLEGFGASGKAVKPHQVYQMHVAMAMEAHSVALTHAMAAHAMAAQATTAVGFPRKVPSTKPRGALRGSTTDKVPRADTPQAGRPRGLGGPTAGRASLTDDAEGYVMASQMPASSPAKATSAEWLRGSVLRLALDRQGCRRVQRAFDVLPAESLTPLAAELKGHVVECAEHQYGNFVLQRCIETVPQASLDFVADELEGHAERLAMHRYGCRTVQKLLEHATPRQQGAVVAQLLCNVEKLVRNTHGHNVVRQMLHHGEAWVIRQVIRAIASSSVLDLANNKSSSLVLETCLHVAANGKHAAELESERALLVAAFTGREGKGAGAGLHRTALHEFGNYVVQRLLDCARGPELQALRRALVKWQPQLEDSDRGRRVLAIVKRQVRQEGAAGGA